MRPNPEPQKSQVLSHAGQLHSRIVFKFCFCPRCHRNVRGRARTVISLRSTLRPPIRESMVLGRFRPGTPKSGPRGGRSLAAAHRPQFQHTQFRFPFGRGGGGGGGPAVPQPSTAPEGVPWESLVRGPARYSARRTSLCFMFAASAGLRETPGGPTALVAASYLCATRA